MRCAIMQPTYLPWLGYFDLIRNADVFVIYDHVQFEKQSWQQRNRIRNKSGELMLTLPVMYGEGLERIIRDVQIDHKKSPFRKHLTSIQLSYSKAISFPDVFPAVEAIYKENYHKLVDVNVALIKMGMKFLGIEKKLIFSSELDVQGSKVEALIDVCKKVQATHYLSPVGSKKYIDENNLFPINNIVLEYQQFVHPVYQQMNSSEFISHLSFLDFLFNTDLKEAVSFGTINAPFYESI